MSIQIVVCCPRSFFDAVHKAEEFNDSIHKSFGEAFMDGLELPVFSEDLNLAERYKVMMEVVKMKGTNRDLWIAWSVSLCLPFEFQDVREMVIPVYRGQQIKVISSSRFHEAIVSIRDMIKVQIDYNEETELFFDTHIKACQFSIKNHLPIFWDV